MKSALPKAIQEQLEQAEAIEKRIAEEQAARQAQQTPAAAPAAPAAGNTEPAQPVAQPAPAPEPTVAAPAEPPPAPVDYEARYKALKGKYDAEVPRLHAQVKESNAIVAKLLEDAKKAQQTPEPKVESPQVDQNDAENFGADLMEAVMRVSQRAVDSAIAKLREELAPIKDRVVAVAEAQEQTQEQQFWARVEALVPDLRAVEQDPRWAEWLDTTPDFSTLTYREIAMAAINRGDAEKVASLMGVWKSSLAPQPAAAQTKRTPKAELAAQVAPKVSGASVPEPTAARIWTKAEYEAAYDPRNYRLLGQERADQLQAEADRAVAEGRVRF